jgi:hypothetical protein
MRHTWLSLYVVAPRIVMKRWPGRLDLIIALKNKSDCTLNMNVLRVNLISRVFLVVCLDQGQINTPHFVYPSNSHNSHTQRLYASCMIAGQESILHTLPPMFTGLVLQAFALFFCTTTSGVLGSFVLPMHPHFFA